MDRDYGRNLSTYSKLLREHSVILRAQAEEERRLAQALRETIKDSRRNPGGPDRPAPARRR